MNLSHFGFRFYDDSSEPDLWDLVPDMELRWYDRRYSVSENTRRYFATWDFGSPEFYLLCKTPHFSCSGGYNSGIEDNITVNIYPEGG